MTRAPRQLRLVAATTLLVLLAGCSGGDDGPAAAGTPTGSPAPDPLPSTSSSAKPTPSRTAAPKPGSMATPDTSAGPLDRGSFPRPRDLGKGWAYDIDAGDAEEGYVGNGTPALARDPREVSLAAVPMGCPRGRIPVPEAALEVDYLLGSTTVIALRAAFASADQASAFFDSRTRAIRRCVGRSGGRAIGDLVGRADLRDGVLVSDRTPDSDPWTELAALDGDQVVLVAAHARLGEPPLTSRQIRRMTTAFGG